jgi:hypothetical protein
VKCRSEFCCQTHTLADYGLYVFHRLLCAVRVQVKKPDAVKQKLTEFLIKNSEFDYDKSKQSVRLA